MPFFSRNIPRNTPIPLAAATLLLCLFVAVAPAADRSVVVITSGDIKPYRDAVTGFKSACGCTTREFDLKDLDAIEQALKERPNAILAVGTRAFRKVRGIRHIPIIYTMVIPSELADTAGDTISGVGMDVDPQKALSTMVRLFPGRTRIGVLFNPEHTGLLVKEALSATAALGVSLITREVDDSRQVPATLEGLWGRIDILWMIPDATVVGPESLDSVMLFSFRNSIPLFSFSEKYVEKGAVAGLSIDPAGMGAQAGGIARSLFEEGKGPIRAFPRNPRLIVNTRVGAKMGVRLNEELVREAKKIE